MTFFILSLLACETEAQKAERLFLAQLEEHKKIIAPCISQSESSPVPQKIAADISTCINQRSEAPYAFRISFEEHTPKIRLLSRIGPQPSLHTTIVQECIHQKIAAYSIDTPTPKTSIPTFPSHTLDIIRDSTGNLQWYQNSGCAQPHDTQLVEQILPPVLLPLQR